MKKHLASLWLLCFFFHKTATAQQLSTLADSIRIKNNIPALAFAVVSADSIYELQALGDTKLGGEAVNAEHYFHLGSNTKAITGFIAARLVEQGKITWQTKFFDLFPSWKNSSNEAFSTITLADLLSHRAKIQAFTTGAEYKQLPTFKGKKSEKRKKFCKHILKNDPAPNPNNEPFLYSNAGYSLAALMLEKVSKKTWESLVQEVLTKNLNLKFMLGWPNRTDIKQPWGHWVEQNKLKALPPETNYRLDLGEPAGDLSMPLTDYAKFIQINLAGLANKNHFLSSETFHFLHFGIKSYSIGWKNLDNGTLKISEHAGSDGTFFSYCQIDHNKKLAFIIIMNCATQEAQTGLVSLLKTLKTKYK